MTRCGRRPASDGLLRRQIETIVEKYLPLESDRETVGRLEDGPIEQAPCDDPRPGRPPVARGHQREQLFEQLRNAPTAVGYEQQSWSPELLLCHAGEQYGVEYSREHARKLLDRAGLSSDDAAPSARR